MKQFALLLLAITLVACGKEEPKDYLTFSGTVTNQNSDSIIVRSRSYSKTIKVNSDGTFKDTLKVEAGFFNIFDGKEATTLYFKNGDDLVMMVNAKEFDESLSFQGSGSENNNFLAKKMILESELLDQDKLSSLNSASLATELNQIKTTLSEYYNSNASIDSTIIAGVNADLEPMLSMYHDYFASAIALKEEFPVGSPSPIFENYENIKGGTTSLSDLKGKYVYIDVWATWCGPCKAEAPYFKKVAETYKDKNIHFVGISVDDARRSGGGDFAVAKGKWKAMIKDDNLAGIQLLSDADWKSKFVEGYKINGIPRFILIDPEGNVVDPDAPRPSSEKLIELFNALNI